MPIIPLNFDGVETFENLPVDKYFGQIDKVELKPSTEPGKFDQIQVTYIVTDGELLGRKSSEFLSQSPKAAFRMKRWWDKFGFEAEGLDFDDETNLLVDPELTGQDVIFEVYRDPKLYQGEVQYRTQLVSVEDGAPPEPVAPPARRAAAAAPTRRAAAPVEEPADGDDTEPEDPPEAAPARRPAPRPAAAAGPARRTLR